jgi:hypothetical protein
MKMLIKSSDAIPCRTLLNNHKRQSNSFPFSLVDLKLNYTFQEVDGQLNVLVTIQTEIHISALSFGDDHRRVYTLLFP